MSATAIDIHACVEQSKVSQLRMKTFLKLSRSKMEEWQSHGAILNSKMETKEIERIAADLTRHGRPPQFGSMRLPAELLIMVLGYCHSTNPGFNPWRSEKVAATLKRVQHTCTTLLFLVRANGAVTKPTNGAPIPRLFPGSIPKCSAGLHDLKLRYGDAYCRDCSAVIRAEHLWCKECCTDDEVLCFPCSGLPHPREDTAVIEPPKTILESAAAGACPRGHRLLQMMFCNNKTCRVCCGRMSDLGGRRCAVCDYDICSGCYWSRAVRDLSSSSTDSCSAKDTSTDSSGSDC